MNATAKSFRDSLGNSNQFADIRERLSITFLWNYFHFAGRAAKSCKSPFRDDRKNSFSVFVGRDGFERYHDHATGSGGDVVDFYASATNTEASEAARRCREIIDGHATAFETAAKQERGPEKFEVCWPADLREPTDAECRQLSELRKIPAGAFLAAGSLGILKVGTYQKRKVWITTDSHAQCGECRTFDGSLFEGDLKTKTLYGSRKSRPLGLWTANKNYDALKRILLVEGVPDLYAGLAMAIESPVAFRVVAVAGAGIKIELGDFRDAHVLTIPHNDAAGLEAADRWAQEVYLLGASKVTEQRLPVECEDLNHALTFTDYDPLQLIAPTWTLPHP